MSENPRRSLLLVAGPSGGGKTTLAERLLHTLGEHAILLSTDNYYLPQDNLSLPERALNNYDHPKSVEFDLLSQQIESLLAGQTINIPVYDFATHTRSNETWSLAPRKIIILEGILALFSPKLRQLASLKIFVRTPLDLCLRRRIERDVRERGRTRESVISQWKQTVLPMYHEFCEPSQQTADLILEGDADIEKAVTIVLERLPSGWLIDK